MQERMPRGSTVCNVLMQLSCIVIAALALTGCEEEIPPNESARILLMTRPETIDRSLVEEFSIRFGDDDPLAQPVTVVDGSKLHVTGTLRPKDGVLDPAEYLNLKIGRRRIVDGRADWSLQETDESVQRLMDNEWGVGIKANFDVTVAANTEPGDYELRFYAIRNTVLSDWDYLPKIFLLGEGRMTVLPAESPSGTPGSNSAKK